MNRSPALNIAAPRRGLAWLAAAIVLWGAAGASCPRTVQQYTAMPARVLPETATLSEVTAAVNQNTERVNSLVVEHATISGTDTPTLSALLALERPTNFRLRAKTAFSGPEIDLGSNADQFWFWVRRNDPPAVYFCRHSEYPQSNVRHMLPVEPKWLIEAMGLVTFDPEGVHRGPIRRPDGKLEVHTMFADAPEKPQRVVVLDEATGWVLEQHVLDEMGQRLATATASQHRRDPLSNATLPGLVEIHWPPAQFSLSIELRDPQVNAPPTEGAELFQRPALADTPAVDIGDPAFQPPPPPATARVTPASHFEPRAPQTAGAHGKWPRLLRR